MTCKELSLEGGGSISLLKLSLKSLKSSPGALKLLSSVRDLHLKPNFHGNPKYFEIPSLKWDSLKRAVIHQFKEKTLNSLVEEAPLLRELILEGRVLAENGEFTEKLKIRRSSIRMLKIEGLSEVEEIKLRGEKEGREIIIMRGNNQAKVSVVAELA